MNDSSCIFEIIYNTLLQSHNTMSVKTLCEMAGVSRSGYYVWLKAASSRALREQQDRDDFELILAAFKMHGYSKGTKGIYMALLLSLIHICPNTTSSGKLFSIKRFCNMPKKSLKNTANTIAKKANTILVRIDFSIFLLCCLFCPS